MERTLHVQSRFCSMLSLPMHAGLTSDIPMAHTHGRPSWWRANRASEVGDHCRRVGEGCFCVFRARRRIVRCGGGDSWVQPAVCKRKVCMEFPRCARAPCIACRVLLRNTRGGEQGATSSLHPFQPRRNLASPPCSCC